MKKIKILFIFLFLSIWTFGQILVTVPEIPAVQGSLISVPVTISGADISGTPLSSANIHITYDTTVLTYVNIVNFYSGTPEVEWLFNAAFNDNSSCNSFTVSATWMQLQLLAIPIPDSTTLFEIQFMYQGGSCPLNFCISEFTDVNYELVSVTVENGSVYLTPSLTGPVSVCKGSTGNVYTTEPGQSGYSWSLTGGTITSGGTSVDNTAVVTWNSTGSISVSYSGSATSTLPVTVNLPLAVSVSIAASANPSCLNVPVTFTATAVNGGPNPIFQWKKNGTNVGTNSSTYIYAPTNSDNISCVVTTSASCTSGSPATSNTITMSVLPITAGITITVSQNPVPAGTSVTFVAVATNGGSAPSFQWNVNGTNAGTNSSSFTYIPANGDVVNCVLTSNAPCVTGFYTSNPITMSVNSTPGLITVMLPTKTAMPGDVLTFPVKLKGAGNAGTPISSANIHITYDTTVLQFNGLVNFYPGMPENQWTYNKYFSTIGANWMEPNIQTVSIPDSTSLYDLSFTYLGGTCGMLFIINEFTNASYDLVPTTHVNGEVNQLVPYNTSVEDVTITSGQSSCFDALQVITVAGDGKICLIQSGGSADFIAGQKILFRAGTKVENGGLMHGYITTTNGYCTQEFNPLVNKKDEEILQVNDLSSVKNIQVYPNPTTGTFTVQLNSTHTSGISRIEMYSMTGMKTASKEVAGAFKAEFSIPGLKPGLYFIHVVSGDDKWVEKLIKL